MILMDTSYLILLAKGSPRAEKVIDMIDDEGGVLTSISFFEIFRSRRKMSNKEARYFIRLFSTYSVLPFDIKAADEAATLWSKLEQMGRLINLSLIHI